MPTLPRSIVRHKEQNRDPYEVHDTGRRGQPLAGCDCVQCFGRCMVNPEVRNREALRRADERERADEG